MKARSKPTTALRWRRPIRESGRIGIWRRYFSACGQYRVSVRISGPGCTPAKFYAEIFCPPLRAFGMIGNNAHRTKAAAVKACDREARRAAQ